MLRVDCSSLSPSVFCWGGRKEAERDMGDAPCVEPDADMSGEFCSNSGEESWLPLSAVLPS